MTCCLNLYSTVFARNRSERFFEDKSFRDPQTMGSAAEVVETGLLNFVFEGCAMGKGDEAFGDIAVNGGVAVQGPAPEAPPGLE